jgi:NADPH-dependent stearoyl-CoA 9-desaturase
MQTLPVERTSEFSSDEQRLQAFGRALDELRTEVEANLGSEDVAHIARIRTLSRRLELLGRGLIHFSFEPLGFGAGVLTLWLHKSLELMEIGHMALHGAYEGLTDDPTLQADKFKWKAPIDEESWRAGHNVRHHQYTNIAGRDPDLDFGQLRLSPRIRFKKAHRLQPISNLLTWFGFAQAINLHVTGMLDVYLHSHADKPYALADRKPATVLKAHRTFLSKNARYYGREFVLFPLLAGPFFLKTLLGNLLSEVGRDLYAAATIYCGHVGASDYPEGTPSPSERGRWYAMQVEGARDFDVPPAISILCGALDKQIEHHLFPRLPPNRLREIAPRVKALCAQYGVQYRASSWPDTLRDVFKELRKLSSPVAAPLMG